MRLGGPIFEKCDTPESWVRAVTKAGYRAAYCPISPEQDEASAAAYAEAARQADIVIAEVGAWSNPLSPDEPTRTKALDHCKRNLALADHIGARCCVNIAGSRGAKWDGPCKDDLTDSTFQLIVETVRDILDAVKPTRTFYTLETMPWMYPDSADGYLRLIKAIDRDRFAVHLDPVNLVCSPQRCFNTTALLKECFHKLGRQIKSCHAKDIVLRDKLTVHLDEIRPGLGLLDYRTYLRELAKLDDVPLMLEHLPAEKEYLQGAEHIRAIAKAEGVAL